MTQIIYMLTKLLQAELQDLPPECQTSLAVRAGTARLPFPAGRAG